MPNTRHAREGRLSTMQVACTCAIHTAPAPPWAACVRAGMASAQDAAMVHGCSHSQF